MTEDRAAAFFPREARTSEPAPAQYAQVRLARTYDVDRLRRDLDAVRHLPSSEQPGPYHDGSWRGVSLYGLGGRQAADGGYPGTEPYRPTEALTHTPYMRSVIEGLDCPIMTARLFSLPPGGEIREHYDARANFFCGALRLHIPIVTHSDVEFLIGGERCQWGPGELWYGDFSLVHQVTNRSPVNRVHLVIDVEINRALLELFPETVVAAKAAQGAGIALALPTFSDATDLSAFCGAFQLPTQVMPLFGAGAPLSALAGGATGRLVAAGDRLVSELDGFPPFALRRVGPATFNIMGLSSGCQFEFDLDRGRAVGLKLRLRGLHRDLFAAQLGVKRGELVFDRTVPIPFVPQAA